MSTALETVVEFKKIDLAASWPSNLIKTYTVPAGRYAKFMLHYMDVTGDAHIEIGNNTVLQDVSGGGAQPKRWPVSTAAETGTAQLKAASAFLDSEIWLGPGETVKAVVTGTQTANLVGYVEEYNIP